MVQYQPNMSDMKPLTASPTEALKNELPQPQPLATVSKPLYQRRRTRFILAVIALSFITGLLIYAIQLDRTQATDLQITRNLQALPIPYMLRAMSILSFLGELLPGALLLASASAYLAWRLRRLEAGMLILSTLGAVVISNIVKYLVARPRPNPQLIQQHGVFLHHDSFPSGHVLFYMGLFGFLLYLTRTLIPNGSARNLLTILWLNLLILIGVSRLYLGAHWFTDVLGAYLIGSLWLLTLTTIYEWRKKPSIAP